eukprot:TRINITY_DN408_c0_g1_i1.p1 TRINITY_DN408_c0_g1~~TRINITY_DN408_c0_g1_i1.p1  ORF type:complete len:242 (-),score=70.47 TRINITY_DN408_c0_g1_i1:225-950(-)
MKVVGQRLSETLKAQSSVNSLTKALVIIANLIIHEDTNPEFISMIAKWRPGFVKLSEVYSIDAVGEVDVGVKVRQLATSVVEILDDALLEEPQQEDNKPPAYHEEAGEQEEENKQLEGEVEPTNKKRFVKKKKTNSKLPPADRELALQKKKGRKQKGGAVQDAPKMPIKYIPKFYNDRVEDPIMGCYGVGGDYTEYLDGSRHRRTRSCGGSRDDIGKAVADVIVDVVVVVVVSSIASAISN